MTLNRLQTSKKSYFNVSFFSTDLSEYILKYYNIPAQIVLVFRTAILLSVLQAKTGKLLNTESEPLS